nr:NEL-type E3 ubiquitin ligase domain-containing protein [uncultured Pseudomonas sp.]
MPDTPTPTPSKAPVSPSLHGAFIDQAIPTWLTAASPERRAALKASSARWPEALSHATASQRQTLSERVVASFNAQSRLDAAMTGLQDIDSFAAPLLVKALKDQFKVELDVNTTFVHLTKPLEAGIFNLELSTFDVLKLPLLQAAVHNFEASESEPGAFHHSSGFLQKNPTGHFDALSTTLTVEQFIGLCRSLDLGAKYQVHIKDYLQPKDGLTEPVLREKFATVQKTALRAAAELALLKKDIEPADYDMILSVINGELRPRVGDKPVWFRDLSLMKRRMTGCVVFSICEQYRYSDALIVYIPNDPQSPLKRYTTAQLREQFKQRFTAADAGSPQAGSPTAYQQFFSRFVAYADRPYYFSQFCEDAPDTSFSQKLAPYGPLLNELVKGTNPFSVFFGIKVLPPARPVPKVSDDDPYLNPQDLSRKGHGLWAENVDLWRYLFDQHRDKLIADARSHAVPTADVDARVRSEKFSALLSIGMLVLTAASLFVPVLGEMMMVLMAGQLLYETLEGVVEWSEGDVRAAKAHLIDVAENIAFMAVAHGVGKGLTRALKPTPVIENLHPVTLPDGQVRLWKPDLAGYDSPVMLRADVSPDAMGMYAQDGKHFIRQGPKVYETRFDEALKRWRIRHPTQPNAYEPELTHNGLGAWRHTLERPQTWDRLTLLRRMGPVTERFSDEQLLKIGDVSAIGDNALRKMHLDNLPPPPELADSLRLFQAEQDVDQVIGQVQGTQPIDSRYLFSLPLITELPRWPAGRVLQVFESAEKTGPSIRYGSERLLPGLPVKPPIQLSRADVLSGDMPTRILAALEEEEVVGLLGGEPARVPASRPEEFRRQLADFAQTRRPALFDSIYTGTEPVPADVAALRRVCPGLSDSAAQAVLMHADSEQLTRLHTTGRVPLALQEHARWYARQGRLSQAYAGLHLENMASADSRRVALQALSKLPGWPQGLRLEIREGSIDGPLLDGIGDPASLRHKYLVKLGPRYQAFDERGQTLNSLPVQGDNFYASLMHALPDDARQALGVPQVGQSVALRQAIIDQAMKQPLESAQVLEETTRRKTWFKPPRRINERLLGYPASGDGPVLDPSLIGRVQAVYPALTDEQANGFILQQRRAGKTSQQISSLLNNRQREWLNLEATLDQWVGPALPQSSPFHLASSPRFESAQAIKNCWRNAPLADDPEFARLMLRINEPLPRLEADFSHVQDLDVRGAALTDATVEGFLGQFPQVRALTLVIASPLFRTLPGALNRMARLKSLSLSCINPFAAEEVAKLAALTQLETLSLSRVMASIDELDVSRLTRLRTLRIDGVNQGSFPIATLGLEQLERLDLFDTRIDRLPQAMFDPRHAKLWRGLSLDWGNFNREHFRLAYEYVKNSPQHIVELEHMVSGYSRSALGRLSEATERTGFDLSVLERQERMSRRFEAYWQTPAAQFDAIEALSDEHGQIMSQLQTWYSQAQTPSEMLARSKAYSALKRSWCDGLRQRFGETQYSSALDLSNLVLSDLPALPVRGFDHVTTLRLSGLRAPHEQLRGFIGTFQQVQHLDLSGCSLAESPLAGSHLPWLEHLDLRNNPLSEIDLSDRLVLKSVDLSDTRLQRLPSGTEQLPELSWLNLANTPITEVPATVLSNDNLLMSCNFTGVSLTTQAQAALERAWQRLEIARGLPSGAMKAFSEQAVPLEFPPVETPLSIANSLLPIPSGAPSTLHVLTRRLNGWLFIRRSAWADRVVSAASRRSASERILACWRLGQSGQFGVDEVQLNLSGLYVGDLPTLPDAFGHVTHLDLTGVGLSAQGSNGFLRGFANVRHLALSGQPLQQALPEALGDLRQLEQLELSSVGLHDPQWVYRGVAGLEHLQWLDLSHNNLETFQVDTLPSLRHLDLRNNRLPEWPSGVFQAPHLTHLNLSFNDIIVIDRRIFSTEHRVLMEGTNLSENADLPTSELEFLRDRQLTGRDSILGFTRDDLDQWIGHFADEEEAVDLSEPDEVLPDEVIDVELTRPEDLAPWLEKLRPDEHDAHTALWQNLAAEPDNKAFFNLLSLLRSSREFSLEADSLTRRVWEVIEAATQNTELRQVLFNMAETHGTCIDGRILTFSNLEVKVFEYNALAGIDPTRLEQKGTALLKLSRQLFRLESVENLADKAPGSDRAEVRLKYRIGMRDGWKDQLLLPGQPRHMLYDRPLWGDDLIRERAKVEAAENSPVFYDNLVSRDYWVQYLQEKYPERFAALDQAATTQLGQLEDTYPDLASTEYREALEMLNIDLATTRHSTLVELSRLETGEPAPPAAEPQPGTSQNKK